MRAADHAFEGVAKRAGMPVPDLSSMVDFGVTFGLLADGNKLIIADKIDITLDVQASPTS
ncbi:hypothetical protein [Actinomadura sp. NPDC048394]|uniref:hypothetical protein n=1 Tax=Actinomadura sp. NPDC048394 TaxID=3158223 RepID=UPI003406C44C